MRTTLATALLALAAPLHAIKITSPSKNDVVDPSKGIKVEWTTVNTDPARAHLVLSNMASGHTPFRKDFGEVDLSKGSTTISHDDVPDDEGFQVQFESVDKLNTGILAQSEQFEVDGAASDDDDDDDKTTTRTRATSATSTSASVKTATLTSTFTSGDQTITSTATTLSTISSSATATDGDDDDDKESATQTGSATTSASTAAAAPTGVAMRAGGLVALAAGVAAVMA